MRSPSPGLCGYLGRSGVCAASWRLRVAALVILSAGAVFCSDGRAQEAKPEAPSLKLPDQISQNAFFTIKLPVREVVANPYDPRQIEVEGRFVAPSGRESLVPACYVEGFDALFGVATRDDGWRLNFCAEEAGPYEVSVFLRRNGGAASLVGQAHFVAAATREPGFIGTGRVPSGYFEHRNGRPFFPIGLNFCWGEPANPARYLETLVLLSQKGANCVRVWLAPWWLPVERRAGQYDQGACALLDAILEFCERNGIYVILCLEQSASFAAARADSLWSRSPLNYEQGGPCTKTSDFFTDPEARRLTRRKLRYLVARYGARRSVMAWELFNEVEEFPFTFGTFADNLPAVRDWHREMSLYLRRIDPWHHLIATSADEALQRELLMEGVVDFVQLHVYREGDMAVGVASSLDQVVGRYGPPVLVGEFGSREAKTPLTNMRRGTWASLAAGAAGAGLYWWEFGKVLPEGADIFPAVRRFAGDILWSEEHFARAAVEVRVEDGPEGPEREEDVTIAPGLPFGALGASLCVVGADGSLSDADKLPGFLLGTDQQKLKQECVLDVVFRENGTLIVKVNTVSDRATLNVFVDGIPVGQRVLITGPNNRDAKLSQWSDKWKVYQDVYDKEYSFVVPAGKHQVRVANGGRGWIKIDYLKLVKYRSVRQSPVTAWALAGRSVGLIYAVVTDAKASATGNAPARASLQMAGLPDGLYNVTWYDCDTGAVVEATEENCRGGEIKLSLPGFREQIAAKLILRRWPAKEGGD